mgnify:FL=1
MEGPFSSMQEAGDRLETYKRVMSSGFMPEDSKLAIESVHSPFSV